jgi:hypothetical protein
LDFGQFPPDYGRDEPHSGALSSISGWVVCLPGPQELLGLAVIGDRPFHIQLDRPGWARPLKIRTSLDGTVCLIGIAA